MIQFRYFFFGLQASVKIIRTGNKPKPQNEKQFLGPLMTCQIVAVFGLGSELTQVGPRAGPSPSTPKGLFTEN